METELRKRFRRGSRRFLSAELTDALIVEARGGQNAQALLAHFLGVPIAAP